MQIDLFWLIAAAAGGFFGAAIGALQSFIFCGVTVLLGVVGNVRQRLRILHRLCAVRAGLRSAHRLCRWSGCRRLCQQARLANGKDIVTPLITLRQS